MAVTTNETNHGEHDKVTPHMTVEDRYYKIPKYIRLLRAKKLGLRWKENRQDPQEAWSEHPQGKAMIHQDQPRHS